MRTCLLIALWAMAAPAFAQTAATRPIGRVEIDAGGGVLGGAALGSAAANLLANEPTRRDFPLFTADSRLAPAPTWHLRGGYAFNRRFGVEGGAVVSHPEIRTSLSGDLEGAPALTVLAKVDQYFFEASLLVMLDELRIGSRTVPFAVAGAGYLRQLHEGLTVIEEGQVYHLGGGVKHWLMTRDQGRIRAAGVRADARLYLLASGISFDNGRRSHAAASGSLFISF